MHDGTLRYMSMGVLLYLMMPLLVLYGMLMAISHHGGELVDWAIRSTPAMASPSAQAKPAHAAISPESIQLMALRSTASPSESPVSKHNSITEDWEALPQWREDQYTEEIDRTVEMDEDGRFEINNISGNITILSWNRPEARIQARKVARASDEEEAAEAFEEVTIEIEDRRGDLTIRTIYPDNRDGWWDDNRPHVSVHYEVTIPENASVRARSVSGGVEISDMKGEVNGRSVSGNVQLTNIDNRVRGESVSGNVAARNLTGETELKSVSGRIEAQDVSGDIEAHTTSGRVELRDVTAMRLFAKSVSGTLRFEGPILRDGRYELETMSGGVRLTVPEDAAFELRAKTFSGSVNSDLPVTLRSRRSSRNGRQKSLDGTVNGGGASVEISAFSGSIDIRTR